MATFELVVYLPKSPSVGVSGTCHHTHIYLLNSLFYYCCHCYFYVEEN